MLRVRQRETERDRWTDRQTETEIKLTQIEQLRLEIET